MKKSSLWLDCKMNNDINKLNKDIDIDVLIIGGGITGLTTLYNLKNSSLKVCLVDSYLIGHGVSGKTTAKINYLQELVYQDITKKYSLNVARWYLDSQKYAIRVLNDIIRKEKIACDLKKVKSYVLTSKDEDIKKVKLEKDILEKLNVQVEEHFGLVDGIESKYAISVDDTYVFNPLKYLNSIKEICLKNGKKIYEKTKILNIKKINDCYVCTTKNNKITAKKVVVACHYPFFLFPYFMPIKTHIEKSYIKASLDKNKDITLITSNKPTYSVRYYNEYKIFLTNSSNLCCRLNEKDNFENVIDKNSNYIWKNDDLITPDKIPYIGRLKKNDDNFLIGTGYNTWGMTNGTLAGMILSDMILEKKNKYEDLCNPLRVNNMAYIGSFLFNIGCNMKGYIQSKLFKNKKWYPYKVVIKNIDGKSVGIYKEKGKEYKVYNKCPHMGCSLIFNEIEKTWDCPCHASRFDINGKCIKGPSKYDIEYKK